VAGRAFGEMKVETSGGEDTVEIPVFLGELDPNGCWWSFTPMAPAVLNPCGSDENPAPVGSAPGGYVYRAQVSAARPAGDYTVRLIPRHDGVAVPLETAHILWQR